MTEFYKDSNAGQDEFGFYNIAESNASEISYFDLRDLKRNLITLKNNMANDPELYVIPDSPYYLSQSEDKDCEYYFSEDEVRIDTPIQSIWYALNEIATLSAIVDSSFAFKRTNDILTSGYVKRRRSWEQINNRFGQYHWREWSSILNSLKGYKRTKTLARIQNDNGTRKISRLKYQGRREIIRLKEES